eukprot:gene871-1695_t
MTSFVDAVSFLNSIEMNEPRFLSLLGQLIGETKNLQNSPSQGFHPQEDLASNHVLKLLEPYTKPNGPLEVERISFMEGRGNVIIKYPGTTDKICSFIGSHLDVVSANPEDGWDHDPFQLVIEGDTLYGRGTTDCLGHVALLTDFMATLGEKRPVLKTSIVVIFIANEESSVVTNISIDRLKKEGYMDALRAGPVFWVDSADSQPCIGTAGVIQWQLTVTGKAFHSGLPHHGINAIEMAMDAVNHIQSKFYAEFPKHPREDEYNFKTCSTMKPTQIGTAAGSLNQIPNTCTVQGDIRVSPFYDVADVRVAIERYVAEINADPAFLVSGVHGPHSKYTLPNEDRKGRLELAWVTDGENGVACSIDSVGHHAICAATKGVTGSCEPYSISGSLPLVRDLQEDGFDLQICGYGQSTKYHATNESASLSGLKTAVKIISKVVAAMEEKAPEMFSMGRLIETNTKKTQI